MAVFVDGAGPPVPPLTRVYVNAVGVTLGDSSAPFLVSPREEVDFTLGHATVPKGVEVAVAAMKADTIAIVRCAPTYSYSDTRRPESVRGDATLAVLLRVRRYEKEKNLHEMSADDKIAFAVERTLIGKRLVDDGLRASATKQYERALSVLSSMTECASALETRRDDLTVQCANNVAACAWSLGDDVKTVQMASNVLRLQPNNVRALYRRAAAYERRDEFDDAIRDFAAVIDAAAADETIRHQARKHIAAIKRADRAADRLRQRAWSKKSVNLTQIRLYDDRDDDGAADAARHLPLQSARDVLILVRRWFDWLIGRCFRRD